jgi:hypothetical protein
MHYPDLSTQVTQLLPSVGKPDKLLTELHEAQLALAIAVHHIRLWRAQFANGENSYFVRSFPARRTEPCTRQEEPLRTSPSY